MLYTEIRNDIAYAVMQQQNGIYITHCYWGEPGWGKTQKIQQVAEELGLEMYDVLLSTLSPTDIMALMPKDGELVPFFNNLFPWEDKVGHKPCLLFLDEIDKAHAEVKKTCLKLVNEHGVNGKRLGPNVVIVMAGNRLGDRAQATPMGTALSNRVTHRMMTHNTPEFIDFLEKKYGKSEVEKLTSYLNWKPLGPENFKAALSIKSECGHVTWANPRSVERIAQRLVFENQNNRPHDIDYYIGDVGEGWAREFHSYLQNLEAMPDREELIKNPEGVKVPAEVNVQYAISALLSTTVDKKSFASIIKFIGRMDIAIQALFVRLLSRKPELTSSKTYMEWLQANKKLQQAVIG